MIVVEAVVLPTESVDVVDVDDAFELGVGVGGTVSGVTPEERVTRVRNSSGSRVPSPPSASGKRSSPAISSSTRRGSRREAT